MAWTEPRVSMKATVFVWFGTTAYRSPCTQGCVQRKIHKWKIACSGFYQILYASAWWSFQTSQLTQKGNYVYRQLYTSYTLCIHKHFFPCANGGKMNSLLSLGWDCKLCRIPSGRERDQPPGHCQQSHIIFLFFFLWNMEVLPLTPCSIHFHD